MTPQKFTSMIRTFYFSILTALFIGSAALSSFSQMQPPAPSAPRSVKIPAVKESTLKNGLKVAVVEKHSSPLVTIQLLVRSGAQFESEDKAGLADITATMLTKGTTTRTATDIAEAVEFLGGNINTGAGWNNSTVTMTVTSDKVDQAMAILSDVVLNPKFDQKELDLLRSQKLDGLTFSLKQPSSIAGYVASSYSFGEHPVGGTPESVASITVDDVKRFYSSVYGSDDSVLIFTGDITSAKASSSTQKYFSSFKRTGSTKGSSSTSGGNGNPKTVQRILVVDLPKSGQAAVGFFARNYNGGRNSAAFYPASVMNSVLGGGYSSRLNMEIRIKRGLSYGAGSGFTWRDAGANFSTRAQTKNESAAEVAELLVAEIKKMGDTSVAKDELIPRKSVLTGNFGRNLETTSGLAAQLGTLYAFKTPTTELNQYVSRVEGVTPEQIKLLAAKWLVNGDLIIVGDYSKFKDDLAKRFPGITPKVIAASSLVPGKADDDK